VFGSTTKDLVLVINKYISEFKTLKTMGFTDTESVYKYIKLRNNLKSLDSPYGRTKNPAFYISVDNSIDETIDILRKKVDEILSVPEMGVCEYIKIVEKENLRKKYQKEMDTLIEKEKRKSSWFGRWFW